MRLSPADWKYRHAGLMALSAIGEGCHQQMEAILQEIVSFVLIFCSDPVRNDLVTYVFTTLRSISYGGNEFGFLLPPQHPRVRYAACNAIGQMATDFAPTFQKKFHDKVTNDPCGTGSRGNGLLLWTLTLHPPPS